jgi:N-acetylglucosaminyl-diphospho-decaprenol L-rhamnosyltransferase
MRAAPNVTEINEPTGVAASGIVDAVVVSYNTRDYLARCLAELASERAIVVDSASTDGSVTLVRERFPDAEIVSLQTNRGFGAAANEGFEHVRSRYALLLNADAWPQPGALQQLISVADRAPRSAVVAPRLLNEDGSLQRSVFGYPTNALSLASWMLAPGLVTGVFRRWQALHGLRRSRKLVELRAIEGNDFPAGAALLIRMTAFEEVGGFDEAFFMYSEETDLCQRLRRLGWEISFAADATFVHVGGASASQAPEANEREQLRSYLRFLAKHNGMADAKRAHALMLWAFRLRAVSLRGGARARARRNATWLASTDLETLLS